MRYLAFKMNRKLEIYSHAEQFKLYRYRWYMLTVLALLNFSNGVIWISFSNIVDTASIYFEASTFQIDLLSIVFMVATLIFGVPSLWLLDKYGVKPYFYIAAFSNCIGASIRYLSTLPCFHRDYKYIILLVGQSLAGCAQPFMMFAPTKLGAQWFGAGERTIANTIGSLSNPIGFSLGGLLPTLLVSGMNGGDDDDLQKKMRFLMGMTAIPALLALTLTFGVLNSEPPTPPSSSANHEIEPFFGGLKMLVRMKGYLLLSFCYGTGIGIVGSVVTVMSQLLLPHGYSNIFCAVGVCSFVSFGFIGASIASVITDRRKNHEFVAKVAFCLGAIFILLFITLSHFPGMDIPLLFVLAIAGFFCLSVSPISLELAVESTYPVAVGTSSGVMVIFGQLMSALLTFLLSIDSQPITSGQGEIINQYALVFFMASITPVPVIFLLLFTSPNLRINFEWMTTEGLLLLPQDERASIMEGLKEMHASCICSRPENMEPSLVINVTTGDDDDDDSVAVS